VRSVASLRAEVRQHKIGLLIERDGPGCFYCDRELKPKASKGQPGHVTFDHVHPRSRGGEDGLHHYVLSCEPRNQDKGNGWTFLIKVIRRLRTERIDLQQQRSAMEKLERRRDRAWKMVELERLEPQLFEILANVTRSALGDEVRGTVHGDSQTHVTINN
jgi:HNH endonuclease